MRWQRFFLLLFLIPTLVIAYDGTDYNKDLGKIAAEWTRHNELVEQFNKVKPEEREQGISLIRESIACCQRAIGHCDHIIKKINDKSGRIKKKWKYEKKKAEEDKDKLNARINNLQTSINNVLIDIALSKAIPLYQESAKKANLAEAKNKSCVRRLNNIEEVVAALDEVCKLYDEALKLARESFNLISPYPDEESKNVLKNAIEAYQAAADRYKKEATEWPASVVTQKTTLKEKVSTLKGDSKLLTEKGLKRSCYELQKQAVPLL